MARAEVRSGAHGAPPPPRRGSRPVPSTLGRTTPSPTTPSPPTGGARRLRPRGPRRWPRVLGIGVLLVALAGAAVGIKVALTSNPSVTPPAGCRVLVNGLSYNLSFDQAANATTIAAVGKRMGLADHAVSIALATAFQESRLHNLNYGDADSLGLFQQRPSQGWGTAAEVMIPSHAAQTFYEHLTRVPGWETLPVTVAAQTVQRSGAPGAYADWEPEARALAQAFTGETAAGMSCVIPSGTPAVPTPTSTLDAAIAQELGRPALGTVLDEPRGWTVANWLVGHAAEFGIQSVTFLGRRWTPASDTWQVGVPSSPTVVVTRTPSAS